MISLNLFIWGLPSFLNLWIYVFHHIWEILQPLSFLNTQPISLFSFRDPGDMNVGSLPFLSHKFLRLCSFVFRLVFLFIMGKFYWPIFKFIYFILYASPLLNPSRVFTSITASFGAMIFIGQHITSVSLMRFAMFCLFHENLQLLIAAFVSCFNIPLVSWFQHQIYFGIGVSWLSFLIPKLVFPGSW